MVSYFKNDNVSYPVRTCKRIINVQHRNSDFFPSEHFSIAKKKNFFRKEQVFVTLIDANYYMSEYSDTEERNQIRIQS